MRICDCSFLFLICDLCVLCGLSGFGESRDNFLGDTIRARCDLFRGLVLDRMWHVDSIETRTAKRTRLYSRRSHEFSGGNRYRGNSQIFQPNRIVQTARCA